MKKLLLVSFVIYLLLVFAQPYNNSWIDYNKTYYKFKIGKTGLYTNTTISINSIGLANTPAEQFQLWRNGER